MAPISRDIHRAQNAKVTANLNLSNKLINPLKMEASYNDSYTVGWICAITTEYVAAQAFLDEKHDMEADIAPNDNNHYTLGRIGKHNVVIAVLPNGEHGTSSAASVARDMLHNFPNIRIGLMVGIGGGAPSSKHDIRLGDVVVSAPRGGNSGVFQYDFGKTVQDQSFRSTGFLNQPPTSLRTSLNGLKARYEGDYHQIKERIAHILQKEPRLQRKYGRPAPGSDKLYQSNIVHPTTELVDEATSGAAGEADNGSSCAHTCGDRPSDLVVRPERTEDEDDPAIHYGLIASANQLMNDALIRDRLAAEKGVLCFEMEAAGLMNHFPCLVIRGICHYSDTHDNKQWQGYAAMTAAAYARDLLEQIPHKRVEAEKKIVAILSSFEQNLSKIRADTLNVNAAIQSLSFTDRDENIKQWLAPPDPSINYDSALQQRHKDTGL